ncbi:MAG: glycosyltransferase family 2 protein [Clostridia bacterium]|nr:glycosyltransferase family 2 protein [Clostridia bacterium]
MIAFVILNYRTFTHTIECVQNIKFKMDEDTAYHIVIVDNASSDESGKHLQKKYEDDEDVTVILNHTNSGFAKGNNIGFEYAKNTLKAKYIVLLNSDTRIMTENIYLAIDQEYLESKAGVIGPLILSGDDKFSSNPMRIQKLSKNDVDSMIKEYKNRLWALENGFFGNVYGKIYDFGFRLKAKIKRIHNKSANQAVNRIKKHENVVLHGSFMIFTPTYINKFDGLDSRTFMYAEEDLLYERCKQNDIKTVYLPNIIVYHYEKAATSVERTDKQKKIFYYKNSVESLSVLKNSMN